jgi:hypothetical protein
MAEFDADEDKTGTWWMDIPTHDNDGVSLQEEANWVVQDVESVAGGTHLNAPHQGTWIDRDTGRRYLDKGHKLEADVGPTQRAELDSRVPSYKEKLRQLAIRKGFTASEIEYI